MNGKQLKKIILEEIKKVLKEEETEQQEPLQKNPKGTIYAALGLLKFYYDVRAKDQSTKTAAISGMSELLQYVGATNHNLTLKTQLGSYAFNEMKNTRDNELYVNYLDLGTRSIEEIKQLTKTQQPASQGQVINKQVQGTKITSVKKEGDFIVVTVASDQYPNVVGTGKAKFRGEMDFARDSAAAQARADLALKIQGQK